MFTILAGFIATVTLTWAWSLSMATGPSASLAWAVYDHGLHLTGLLSVALMSLTMMLATRPAWLERPLAGLDRIYRVHKWAGILAVTFAATHWLVEMGDDVVKSLFGRGGRLPDERVSRFVDQMRDAAEEIGEFAIYLVLAMLVITLWRRFPYKFWRYLHRAMPALYLLVAFHAAWLAPTQWWRQPIGILLAILLTGGSVASGLSLAGLIGRSRRKRGAIVEVQTPASDLTEVVCRLDDPWKGHRPGQFAFVTFDRLEGAHPFTIASANHGNGVVTFRIKALGDYTRGLAQRIAVGQPVTIEGPYGRFYFTRGDPHTRQIWIAGGIGVTPFLAWLESLLVAPDRAPVADLHYCTRNAEGDPSITDLRELCAALPTITLRVHDRSKGDVLSADKCVRSQPEGLPTEVWLCGPAGLATSLREGLQRLLGSRLRFHQEAFELR